MGSTLNHSSWQDHASRRHFGNREKHPQPLSEQQGSCLSAHVQPWGKPWPAVPQDKHRLDRYSGDRQRGRPREEPVAMLMWRRLPGAAVTLPSPPGSVLSGDSSGFFSLPQAAFIFHTGGNWTLSSVIEFLGRGTISVWEIECSAFCYEQDYSGGPVSPTVILDLKMGC